MEVIANKSIIAVEGKDEVNFFEAFLQHLAIQDVKVQNFEGKDNFRKNTNALKLSSGFDKVEKIILVRDADFGENAPENAFKSLQDALEKAGLPIPTKQGQFTKKEKTLPQTAIYIMPYKGSVGTLENLCLDSILAEERKCIEAFFECMPEKPAEKNLSKAKVQAYLAAKKEPINSLGLASKKKLLEL
ncbi:MAG: hypothetical protein HC913_13970 [Microscillaceae bacterium]|nr:hypothetical protein [Microscillaceae bacterium]